MAGEDEVLVDVGVARADEDGEFEDTGGVFEEAADPGMVHAHGGGGNDEFFHEIGVGEEFVDDGLQLLVADLA